MLTKRAVLQFVVTVSLHVVATAKYYIFLLICKWNCKENKDTQEILLFVKCFDSNFAVSRLS